MYATGTYGTQAYRSLKTNTIPTGWSVAMLKAARLADGFGAVANARHDALRVWSIRYNAFHDRLVLSSGSDAKVLLSNAASLADDHPSLAQGAAS
jgi:hypothetical protein